ncbi:transferase transferring acyl groups [Zea mays]|uniref:Transferase transferring acyl groups n=1 Tax=Zea mays TaxID=4577 RepID=A0A1D6P7J8_MAIZE|nr:transferase transferring acyl groups [Zea mays]
MEGRLFDKPLNPNKLLKEQFVSNLTGSSLLEIAALSTVVPALVVLRKWSSRGVDYLTVVLPIILVFTVLSEWVFMCAISLVILISIYIMFKRSQFHLKDGFSQLPLLRADISSYRVSVVLVTCLCILAVDFKIFPRRYAKAETYGSGIMDLGVGSFVVANALVSRQARNIASMSFKAVLCSISPLLSLGFARIISTWGVDYQVHVGEYGVHWNFFFTLAAVSILTSVVRIHPKHCGLVGLLILAGYQIWLSSGLNEYLISHKRSADIITQNKEGIYSILGYWGMFLIGVSLGFYLFVDTSSKGKNRNTQVMQIWVLAASFWILAIIFDSYIERVSRRMCNFAYVMLVFGQNFQLFGLLFLFTLQVLSILTLAGFASYKKNLVLEDAFNENMLGSFLLANILTGLVNLSVNTLSASSFTAFMILSVYAFTLCMVTGLTHFCGVRMKFW